MTNSSLLLNVGSGQRPFQKPWINVDCQPKWKPDVVLDAANLDNHFDHGVADTIVLHHVLEHFGCGEADNLLRSCYKVLATRGSLLVFVPDMDQLARMWIASQLTDQLYLTSVYGAYMGDEADRHKWGFTRKSLRSTLLNAGFTNIQGFNWRSIAGADIAQDRWIIGMEAIK